MVLPIQIVMGLLLAVMLNSPKMIANRVFRLINFLPYITTSVATGMIFSILFDWQHGMINFMLKSIGLIGDNIFWMGSPWPARIMVAIILLWKNMGYTALFFMAGITNINPDLFESARMDGANAFQVLIKITIPLLRTVMRFVILTTLIGCLQLFDEVFVVFSGAGGRAAALVGGPKNAALTVVWYLYNMGFGIVGKYGYAATIGYGMFVVVVVVTLTMNRVIFRRGEE